LVAGSWQFSKLGGDNLASIAKNGELTPDLVESGWIDRTRQIWHIEPAEGQTAGLVGEGRELGGDVGCVLADRPCERTGERNPVVKVRVGRARGMVGAVATGKVSY